MEALNDVLRDTDGVKDLDPLADALGDADEKKDAVGVTLADREAVGDTVTEALGEALGSSNANQKVSGSPHKPPKFHENPGVCTNSSGHGR